MSALIWIAIVGIPLALCCVGGAIVRLIRLRQARNRAWYAAMMTPYLENYAAEKRDPAKRAENRLRMFAAGARWAAEHPEERE